MFLSSVYGAAIFEPGDAGGGCSAGDALQAEGPVEDHRAVGGAAGADGRGHWGEMITHRTLYIIITYYL